MTYMICQGRRTLDAQARENKIALVCQASAGDESKPWWSVISIWWRKDPNRPFLAVHEIRYRDLSTMHDLQTDGQRLPTPYRSGAYGSVWTALDFFEDTGLRAALTAKIPDDIGTRFPNSNDLRAQIAQERRAGAMGYRGPMHLIAVLSWLYPDTPALSNNALAIRFETDFGVKARTVRLALDDSSKIGSWLPAFVNAMAWFDLSAFRTAKGYALGEQA